MFVCVPCIRNDTEVHLFVETIRCQSHVMFYQSVAHVCHKSRATFFFLKLRGLIFTSSNPDSQPRLPASCRPPRLLFSPSIRLLIPSPPQLSAYPPRATSSLLLKTDMVTAYWRYRPRLVETRAEALTVIVPAGEVRFSYFFRLLHKASSGF